MTQKLVSQRLAWGDNSREADWKAAPIYRTIDAHPINSVFVAHDQDGGNILSTAKVWTLTHRRTGFAAGRFKTLRQAKRCADALVRKFGAKRWRFYDFQAARHMEGASAIVAKFGGTRK